MQQTINRLATDKQQLLIMNKNERMIRISYLLGVNTSELHSQILNNYGVIKGKTGEIQVTCW